VSDDSPIAKDMDIIIAQAQRISQMTHNLLDLSRPESNQRSPCDIHSILDKTLDLLKYQLKAIEIKREYDPQIPAIPGSASHLEQVIINLLLNAIQAMPQGGTLTIRTNLVRGEENDLVSIAISDTGQGIPPEHLEYMFQPFFTTRYEEGTGLGLYISNRIVQNHGGSITVESKLGAGSTFTVLLPTEISPGG